MRLMTGKTIKRPNIIEAILNRKLFGSLPAFRDLTTWRPWTVWLKAVFALPMDADEVEIFRRCTGRTNPPRVEPTEIHTIVGRRGGKSFIVSLVAVFVACFRSFAEYLTTGERAMVLILARDRDQAKVVFRYVQGVIKAIGPLCRMIVAERVDEIELNNGVNIAVKTSDYRAIRGVTVVCVIGDEVAFWDSQGVNPDKEILSAIRPAMATIPNAKLLLISTPYSKTGVLYGAYKEFYGIDTEDVLIWQADTRTMNPTIPDNTIQRELERDPEAARGEWLAEFREDLEAAFADEVLEACVIPGRVELPPSSEITYRAFGDPSGGRHDKFAVAIGHTERNEVAVVDLLKAWPPPFDPSVVVGEACEILGRFNVSEIRGDRYAGEWPVEAFRKNGVVYRQAEKTKSELYLALIPVLCARKVELPDNKQLLQEFRRLERRRGRSGKDMVDMAGRMADSISLSGFTPCESQKATSSPITHTTVTPRMAL